MCPSAWSYGDIRIICSVTGRRAAVGANIQPVIPYESGRGLSRILRRTQAAYREILTLLRCFSDINVGSILIRFAYRVYYAIVCVGHGARYRRLGALLGRSQTPVTPGAKAFWALITPSGRRWRARIYGFRTLPPTASMRWVGCGRAAGGRGLGGAVRIQDALRKS